uniref:Uncharacterized protein n=1 Tax=Octopus bimaculoides TaxID=37653 RepID=A0A0L8GPV6_OCTBM
MCACVGELCVINDYYQNEKKKTGQILMKLDKYGEICLGSYQVGTNHNSGITKHCL